MSTILNYAKVFTPTMVLEDSAVVVSDDGKIAYVGPMENAPSVNGLQLDMRGRIVIPGLIDVHVHGGNGITFGTEETLEKDLKAYSKWVVQNGVTGFLTSITAPDAEKLIELIKSYELLFEKGLPGAEGLGIHLEGPYMSLVKKGAQNPDWTEEEIKEKLREIFLYARS